MSEIDTAGKAPDCAAGTPSIDGTTAAVRFDRRTKLYRRRTALVRTYADALGGWSILSAAVKLKVESAAELQVAAELTRQRFITGQGATADDVVRTSRAASAELKALGIEEKPTGALTPTLAEYLALKPARPGAVP